MLTVQDNRLPPYHEIKAKNGHSVLRLKPPAISHIEPIDSQT